MHPKLDDRDPILVDVDALRRVRSAGAIDLTRAPSSRKALDKETGDAITLEPTDPLAAIIALARRKTRR